MVDARGCVIPVAPAAVAQGRKGMPVAEKERRSSARGRAVLGLVCVAMFAAAPAAAFDVRYVDTDGDLVADTPAKTIDPRRLVFAYTPGEDPAHYTGVWEGFLRHLEKATGKRIQLFEAQSNAAQIEAMRAGRLHIAGFGTEARRASWGTRWRSSPTRAAGSGSPPT